MKHVYAETVQFLIHSTASYILYSLWTMLACGYNTENETECLVVSQICFSLKKVYFFSSFEKLSNQQS